MEPRIYTTKDHHIRNDHIDPNALYVLKKLHDAGFIAYLVGGSVRDLLLHKTPKDFDISTSAQPEEIKAIFKRQCLLIGRRFPLAHIRFGKSFIEVATFRAGDSKDNELIVQDNIWGSPVEDVLRRDFTINGLFYDPLDHRIIDYVEGFEDLKKHLLRSIGDPLIRFKQDPVRMIRMQKFQARFGFHIQPEAASALEELREEIIKSSPARVLEEIYRMLESGAAEPFFRLLYQSKFLHILFPKLIPHMEENIFAYLKAADSLNLRGHYRPLFRELLTTTLIYPILEKKIDEELQKENRRISMGYIIDTAHQLTEEVLMEAFSHFPRRLRQGAIYICQMQYRLTPIEKKKHPSKKLVKQVDFIHALTFLKLRSLIDPSLFKIYEHWKRMWKESQEEEIQNASH
jgi:poly(A) polymerase